MSVDPSQMPQYFANNRNPYNYARIERLATSQTTILTAEELRNQLNLFGDDSQDTAIAGYSIAATNYISEYLGVPLVPTVYNVWYPSLMAEQNYYFLDIPQLGVEVLSNTFNVYYYNSSNAQVSVASQYVTFDQAAQRLMVTSTAISTLSTSMPYPIRVTVTITDGMYAENELVKQAVKLLATHLYNNRSETNSGVINPSVRISLGIDALLRPFKPLVM